jgi:hypothetical protein
MKKPKRTTIKDMGGKWVCTNCGREWSGMLGDDEVPEKCNCNKKKGKRA